MRKRQRKKRKMKKREKGKKSTKWQNTEKSLLTVGPAVRSPKSDSWALWTKTCTQLGAYKGFFVSFVTVMPCEVRARNGPVVAGDKPSGFLPFQLQGLFTLSKKVPKRFFFKYIRDWYSLC